MSRNSTADVDSERLDAELEAQIVCAYHKAVASRIRKDWDALAFLIKQRSPAQVRRMELERGLS